MWIGSVGEVRPVVPPPPKPTGWIRPCLGGVVTCWLQLSGHHGRGRGGGGGGGRGDGEGNQGSQSGEAGQSPHYAGETVTAAPGAVTWQTQTELSNERHSGT